MSSMYRESKQDGSFSRYVPSTFDDTWKASAGGLSWRPDSEGWTSEAPSTCRSRGRPRRLAPHQPDPGQSDRQCPEIYRTRTDLPQCALCPYAFPSKLRIAFFSYGYWYRNITAQQARLFQPFTQADSSLSRKYGGTGLGLTIVRSLCELLGGRVEVKSAENKGSTFIARITVQTVNEDAHPDAASRQPVPNLTEQTKGMKI